MASVYYLFAPDEARIPTQAALLASLREQAPGTVIFAAGSKTLL